MTQAEFDVWLARLTELAGMRDRDHDAVVPLVGAPTTDGELMQQVFDRLEAVTGEKWGRGELGDGTPVVLRPAKPRQP